jgi:CRISPR-associated Csx14 family protein
MGNVLIASLGESPIVVTAMYDLLTRRAGVEIERIIALHPEGYVSLAFDYIKEALDGRCEVISERLPFKDADDEAKSYTFLRTLYRLLDDAQKRGQEVYLSLAGGRKNMSALMALLVPLFPCVKGLYHVIDMDESSQHRYHFKSMEDIIDLPNSDRLAYFTFDDDQLSRLSLVEIPYGTQQQVSDEIRSMLFTITPEQLDDLWEKDVAKAELAETYRRITGKEAFNPDLEVRLTQSARDQFERMRRENGMQASQFARCFEQMKDRYHLAEAIHGSFSRDSYSFHFYKRRRTVERPFFHTEPQSIHLLPKDPKARAKAGLNIDTVIISGLAVEQDDGSYDSTGEELVKQFDPAELTLPLEAILPAGASAALPSKQDCALVVPLGTSPMIATQLYTLLTRQGSTIRTVVLVYPANSQQIRRAASLVQKAFDYEGIDVTCQLFPVPGYGDIDSKPACIAYEQELEKVIDAVSGAYQVELALSGGRKGMAALTMFVAQRKGIRYVYHTLIPDSQFSDQVERQTELDELREGKISEEKRNNRLFLRAYEPPIRSFVPGAAQHGGDRHLMRANEATRPETKFVLFKVPVLPSQGHRQ